MKRSKNIWLPWVGWGPNLQDNEVKVQDPMGQVLSSNLVFVVKQAAVDVFVGNHGGTKCIPFGKNEYLEGWHPQII